ncbi:MAG TPA: efflux RND transporter periplasmic adaptor subunit [Bryobacteraceae bacterium]|nr:efflux RND transporter periplasmic adaptor subunit [Bryobacteraceae bacterium]
MSAEAAARLQPVAAPEPPVAEARTKRMRVIRSAAAVLVVLAMAAGAVYAVNRLRSLEQQPNLPAAPAKKGEFFVIVRARGELKARRSMQVVAPVVPDLRIIWLAPQGEKVKAGDPVIRFDPSAAKNQLQEKEAALKQAQAALDQATAEAGIAAEQDKLDLANATYQMERAKLDVAKAEIVSRLQAEESKIDLGLADKKLSVQKATVNLNAVSNRAKIASLTRARDKAKDDVAIMQSRLAQMELKAPLTGTIHFLPNYSQGWMNAKPFKVGDQVWPGGVLAEMPDLETLEMEGKIDEIDRGVVQQNQAVRVRVDSLPEITFAGTLAQLSPMTVMGWEWPPTRTFRGFARIDKPDPKLRPGMNGQMDVVVRRIPSAISVPAKALFTHGGKPIVYVAEKGSYRATPVEVLARNPDEVAISGIAEGTKIALVEPEVKR